MSVDPYGDRLNSLKPEVNVVKNGRTGAYDLRLFDATIDRTYSAELVDEGEGDKNMIRLATQKLVEAWTRDLGIKPTETVVKV